MLAVVLLSNMRLRQKNSSSQRLLKSPRKDRKPMMEYCRTCLSRNDLVSIFYNKETTEKRTEDLRLVTGLEIQMNDGLSQKICEPCIEAVNSALQLRRSSRKAEKMLVNMLLGRKLPKHVQTDTKPVKKAEPKYEVDTFDYEDYSYNYDEGLLNMDTSEVEYNVPVKVEESVVKPKPSPTKKKRLIVPTAPSYKCNICGKEFKMKPTYKAHMRFHTNYCVCETCGKRCRNNNQLQEHKRARHGLGRIHKCAYCEYSSATREALTIHERRHTGERPYICDHCGATFHRRSNLVQHIAIHLPEKNFQCPLCPKREKSRKLLSIHEYKYHRVVKYRYICYVCGDTFTRPGNVRQHLVRSHKVPRQLQPAIGRVEI